MVAGAQQAATAGLQFSIGNEPDLYYLPNYFSLAKTQLGEEAKEVGLYEQIAGYLRQAIGTQPLVAPELANPAHWQAALPGVISALHPQTLGVHSYPLSVCRSPREAHDPRPARSQRRQCAAPARLGGSDARAAGVPAVISEANSVSCGGKSGVSDTNASAVWALRFVLAAVETGFAEVNFHLSGNSYDPFYMRGGEVVRRPIEGALVALQQWLAAGTTLRSLRPVGSVAVATVTGAPGTEPLLLLENESAKPAPLLLRGVASAHPVQVFTPAGTGTGSGTLAPAGAGRWLAAVPATVFSLCGSCPSRALGACAGAAPARRAPPRGSRARPSSGTARRSGRAARGGVGRDHHQELRAALAQELAEPEQHVDSGAVEVARVAEVENQAVDAGLHAVRELLAQRRGVGCVDVFPRAHDGHPVVMFDVCAGHWADPPRRLTSVTFVPVLRRSTRASSTSARIIANPRPRP